MVTDIFSTDKSYSIIYADPPWSFKTVAKRHGREFIGIDLNPRYLEKAQMRIDKVNCEV